MKNYRNPQIDGILDELTSVCQKVSANMNGIKMTVSPLTSGIIAETKLTHVLDVGEEFSFFYNNEAEALKDQEVLCEYLRKHRVSVAKVIKNQPLTLNV